MVESDVAAGMSDAAIGGKTDKDLLRLSIAGVNANNIGTVKMLIEACMPIQYPQRFYDDMITNADLCFIAASHGVPIGAVCCAPVQLVSADMALMLSQNGTAINTLEAFLPETFRHTNHHPKASESKQLPQDTSMPKRDESAPVRLYVMVLCVLAPYRRYGVGRYLIRQVEKLVQDIRAKKARNLQQITKVDGLSLHVWAANTSGLKFYERLGFKNKGEVPQFYPDLSPTNAYFFELDVPKKNEVQALN